MILSRNTLLQSETRATLEPREYQRNILRKVYPLSHVNLWMDPGTGKTLVTSLWLKRHVDSGRVKCVILAMPESILAGWRDCFASVFEQHSYLWIDARSGTAGATHLLALMEQGATPWSSAQFVTVFATTPGMIRSLLAVKSRINWKRIESLRSHGVAFVADESQWACGPESMQGRCARALASRCVCVADVTGTPIGNPKHLRIFGHTQLLKPSLLAQHNALTYPRFKSRYAICADTAGSIVAGGPIVRSVKDELIEAELLHPAQAWTVYQSIRDAAPELPEKILSRRTFVLPSQRFKQYREMLRHERIEWQGASSTARSSIVKRLRCLEICSGWITCDDGTIEPLGTWRLDALRETLDESLESHRFASIWANRTVTLVAAALVAAGAPPDSALTQSVTAVQAGRGEAYRAIVRHCESMGVGLLHGWTDTGAARDTLIRRYQDGALWCLVIHPRAGEAGLNLQHCHRGIVVEQPWGSISRTQMEARHHRLGVAGCVTWYDVMAEGTIEATLHEANAQQRDAEEALMQMVG